MIRLFTLAILVLLSAPAAAQNLLYTLGEHATSNDQFGRSVADALDVDADGINDIVVGAPFDDTGGTITGRVFVYSGRTGDLIWSAGGENQNDLFGWAVAGIGDQNGDGHGEVLVGAPLHDHNGVQNTGKIYSLDGIDGSVWLWGADGLVGAQYGYDVCSLGDIDGNGIPDFAMSQPFANYNGLVQNGRVIVATQGGFGTLAGVISGGKFGYSIDAVLATGNKTTSRMVIGAPGVDASGVDRGAAYLVNLFGLTIQMVQGTTDDEWLGSAVAGVGDVNLDGTRDFAVSSPYADILGVGAEAGRLRIFSGQTGAVLRTVVGVTAGANLGQSVAGVGDVNGDAVPDFLVGAPNDDTVAVDAGQARVYSGANGATLYIFNGSLNDHLGRSVSACDLNQDGAGDWLIGAEEAPFGQGRAYVHLGQTPSPTIYCTAKINSLGCTPSIASAGIASITVGGGLHVSASNVHNQRPGILIWSRAASNVPFQGGTLCVASPIVRTPVQDSGGDVSPPNCSGSYDFTFSAAYCTVESIVPGDTIHTQYWSRDPGASFDVGLTNALRFDVIS